MRDFVGLCFGRANRMAFFLGVLYALSKKKPSVEGKMKRKTIMGKWVVVSFQVLQYDLHLAGCEQLSVYGTKFGNKWSDPPAHGALVHLPTDCKLPDGHGMDWLIHSL